MKLMKVLTLLVAVTTTLVACYCNGTKDVSNCASKKETIRLLTLLPYYDPIPSSNPSWNGGADVQPAVDLAKDQINSNPFILENYTLELIHGEGGCDIVVKTTTSYVEHLFGPGKEYFTGIVGPGCSSSATSLAPLTSRPELGVVLVHGGGSPSLGDRSKYKYLLSTLGSTESFVEAFLSLTTKAQWKRISILYDNSRLYYLNTKRLLLERIPNDVEVKFLSAVSFTFLPLDVIQRELLRVVFIMCPIDLTQRIICLAMHKGMTYKDYQFLIMSHTFNETVQPVTFTYSGTRYHCSDDNLANTALEMAFLFNYNLEGSSIVSNITYSDYLRYYEAYRDIYNQQPNLIRNSTYTYWSTYFYDAVWAWALVLDNLTKADNGFEISNGYYGNLNHSDMILEQFYKTSFQGASGEVSFNRKTGFISRESIIFQVSSGWSLELGRVRASTFLHESDEQRITFINDSFPIEAIRENKIVAAFLTSIEAFIFISIVIFHVITIVYHKRPSIKASSPKLLHLSYIGVYIVVLGTFMWCLFHSAAISLELRNHFCQLLWGWCLPIGFTLSFSPVAMRTWRIYRIFKHYLNPGPLISDPILIGGILLLLLVDVVIAIIWTSIDPFYVEEDQLSIGGGVVKVRFYCNCNYHNYWLGLIFSYKTLTLLSVTIFAILTRRITNRSFATTSLRVFIYLFSAVFTFGFTLYYLIVFLDLDDAMSTFSLITLVVLLQTMTILFIVFIFVPPLFPIFKTHQAKLFKAVIS